MSHRLSQDAAPAAAAAPTLIAGFSAVEQAFPMTQCNNLIGLDGEMLDNYANVRHSAPAHININMWVLNIFSEKDKPESLMKSIDVHNLDLKFE